MITQRWYGLTSYRSGLELQELKFRELLLNRGLEAQRSLTNSVEILGLQHEAVITLGIRSNFESDVLCSVEELKRRGIDVVQTRRGGQATLHSPGQLVVYPIADLERLGIGVRRFVEALEQSTRLTLETFGVHTELRAGHPGVWSNQSKIASIGLQVSQGITRHGVAVSISNDLSLFQLIQPCGMSVAKVTSLSQLMVGGSGPEGKDARFDLEAIFNVWCTHFERVLTDVSPQDYRPRSREMSL